MAPLNSQPCYANFIAFLHIVKAKDCSSGLAVNAKAYKYIGQWFDSREGTHFSVIKCYVDVVG